MARMEKPTSNAPALAKTTEDTWVTVDIKLNSFETKQTNELDGRNLEPDWKKTTFAEMNIEGDGWDEHEIPHWCIADLFETIEDAPMKIKQMQVLYRRTTFMKGDKQLNAGEWKEQ